MVWVAFLLGIVVSLAANIAAAPVLAWRPVLVAEWPPVALLLSVELLLHRRGARGLLQAESAGGEFADDPLLERAVREDARHREAHDRPISAERLRKDLRIGAARSRHLVARVRAHDNDHWNGKGRPPT
ncbi:hypothetical protein [Streptomyces coryli]|uniref:hypothetical protein n=1 Tax=Streptomyces coryli TaxID=1128680 RepID=UPI0019D014BA|nr:hypothetical protein [Streptomyces coryli]